MQKLKQLVLLFIAIAITAFGCNSTEINIDELDIKSGDIYDIAIEGFITTEKRQHNITLSKPGSFANYKFTPINDAKVKVTDGETDFDFELTEDEGIYQTVDSIAGEVGKAYTLIVEYNNRTYYATDSIVECSDVIDYPASEVIIIEDEYESYDFYLFNTMKHNFGYEEPSLWYDNPVTHLGEDSYPDNPLFRQFILYNHVGSIPQGVFPTTFWSSGISGYDIDTLEITKMSVSENYYDYLISYLNISEWSGGIFATIPGNAKTNVSEGGTGYFYCSDIKRNRMTYKELYELIKPTIVTE